ncbi:MAG: glycine-rich domain-containing protein [Candidatus Saccharimonadales bacterium]
MQYRQSVFRKGFALPTVLIASIVLISVLVVAVSATTAIRTALKNQYYAQLAQVAGEAGVAYAKACLAANGNVPQWTNAKPLQPNTDCSGNQLAGAGIKVLVVAGGGSGGGSTGGGGGAGGVVSNDSMTITAGTYPVVVGNGGAAVGQTTSGISGANSTFNGLTAIGGGGGGYSTGSAAGPGLPGGSGGGGQNYYSSSAPGAGTAGQGNSGGPLAAYAAGSGGGGAGGVGLASVATNKGGDGGSGIVNTITGGLVYYGGGGGGGNGGTGGNGGGGNGAINGIAGTPNTGGGGGAGWSYAGGSGGAGGKGVVIVSYPTDSGIVVDPSSGGTSTTNGIYTVRKFTSSGNFKINSTSTGCPIDLRCSVSVNGNVRSSFSIGLPVLSQGKAVSIPYNGFVQILRSSNGSVWKTISQPSSQSAVIPDLCTGQTSDAQGWSSAVRTSAQDTLSVAPSAQSISLADASVNAGVMYFRRDFSVTTAGTYNVTAYTPSNLDSADVFINGTKLFNSDGSQGSGSVGLLPGCNTIVVELTNQTFEPRASRFIAAIKKSDSSIPLIVTDSDWRVSTGDSEHFSSPDYYADPSSWQPARLWTHLAWAENLAAKGITTPAAAGTGYAYFRDNRKVSVSVATPVNIGFACTFDCEIFLDGNKIGTGTSAFVTRYSVTLQPGDHSFAVKQRAAGGSPYFYFTAWRASDNLVLSQTDYNWSTNNVWLPSKDYYSYDASFVPTPDALATGTVSALVVGGGGGGGGEMGGGGGGGGVIYNGTYTARGSVNVVVGVGGPGALAGAAQLSGKSGGNSTFGSITAFGGGGGGSDYSTDGSLGNAPFSGASGGGTAGCNQVYSAVGVFGQGFKGGAAGGCYYPGGGGGAGGAGTINPGTGGIGVANNILGPNYYWGGGGGGSGYTGIGGNGGNGGGGGGAIGVTTGGAGLNAGSPGGGGATVAQANTPGGNAGANTGGGGGGGAHYNLTNKGGNGGSGIVVISYPIGSMTATGGTITTVGGQTVHTFYSSGTFIIGVLYPSVDVLLVGGGGGGGIAGASGGGGAGGVLTSTPAITSVGLYSVTIGAGGAAQTNGVDTTVFGLTAVGGGAGNWANGSNGGSGGGSGRGASSTAYLATGIPSQGNSGGTAGQYSGQYPASGGGGASGVGGSASTPSPGTSGVGGAGISSTLSGSSVIYGGGGGGGGDYGCSRGLAPGAGGVGGGGAGGASGTGNGINGTANTGGGGGGATQLASCSASGTGGTGGSGIVIISYPIGTIAATGGTVTTSGGRTIHTFTTSGTFSVTALH